METTKPKEIKEKCPLAYQKLIDYLKQELSVSVELEKVAEITLLLNIRFLYEFFDASEVFLSIEADKEDYRYKIRNSPNQTVEKGSFSSRGECEGSGFERCFEVLENKLKDNGSNNNKEEEPEN